VKIQKVEIKRGNVGKVPKSEHVAEKSGKSVKVAKSARCDTDQTGNGTNHRSHCFGDRK
jgi:hypothetical protein